MPRPRVLALRVARLRPLPRMLRAQRRRSPASLVASREVVFRTGQYARNTAAALVEFTPPRVHGPALRRLGKTPTDSALRYVNDWSAPASSAHPTPVILVHGTDASTAELRPLAAALVAAGHVVFALDYGHDPTSVRGRIGRQGLADIGESVRALGEFVTQVRQRTGAPQVDLVGHSQGALLAHLYVRAAAEHPPSGAATPAAAPGRSGPPAAVPVRRVVTLASSHAGTAPVGSLGALAHWRPAARLLDGWLGASSRQQLDGSPVLLGLSTCPYDVPGVQWTAIASRTDETIRPPSRSLLPPGPGVRNVWVQDLDPTSRVHHRDLPSDPLVISEVVAALDHSDRSRVTAGDRQQPPTVRPRMG